MITVIDNRFFVSRFVKLGHFLRRPDSSELHHPPPSLANCGTAETREIFRAVGGVCGIRWHQRRARRAERASFSAFVSNPDFRVPRLRQIRWWAADKAVRRRKRGHPRDQNRGRGYRGVAALARSGPGAARASLMSIFPQAWIRYCQIELVTEAMPSFSRSIARDGDAYRGPPPSSVQRRRMELGCFRSQMLVPAV